jgi:hypothetical protein
MSKNKFQIDYSSLDTSLDKKAYKLKDVKHLIEKVGFDICRFKDQDISADLWKVEADEAGEYIVALYQPSDEKTAGMWDVSINKLAGDLQISYKGDPIIRLSAGRLGIPRNELDSVPTYLPAKLTSSKKLVSALLSELSKTAKNEVLKKYPELV